MKRCLHLVICCILAIFSSFAQKHATSYVSVKAHQFYLQNKPYYYVGANYWYGSFLGLNNNKQKGIDRLRKELDFLKAKGINNLRVLTAVEGAGQINGVQRVKPAYQVAAGVFDSTSLNGLDIVLHEMGKRNMKAVLFLSNNWEWTGGFLQYLQWHNLIADTVVSRKLGWDELRDYTSKFYSCTDCIADYNKQLTQIITRTNKLSKIKYANDPTIMAWELANEPRPMRPAANEAYLQWIKQTAVYIKQLDKKHLVTIGHEGIMGTEGDKELYKQVHTISEIDYLTIHIWPKNWGWITNENLAICIQSVIDKTNNYINEHNKIAVQLNKPLVIEEFGLPRDNTSFSSTSTTVNRNKYYQHIFDHWNKSRTSNGAIAGFNFWAFSGWARPIQGQVFWKDGDDYMGDPPMEEQGLNGVFNTDSATFKIFSTNIKSAKNK